MLRINYEIVKGGRLLPNQFSLSGPPWLPLGSRGDWARNPPWRGYGASSHAQLSVKRNSIIF